MAAAAPVAIDNLDRLVPYEVKLVWLDESTRGRGWSRWLMVELEARAVALGAAQVVHDTNTSLTSMQHPHRNSDNVYVPANNLNKNATY